MIPPSFSYRAPATVSEALALLNESDGEAKVLAGGHSLLPMMKFRFAEPALLIDIGRIPELKGIRQVGNRIHIGAMTTENELLESALLKEKCPLLPEVVRWIADPQVRNRGTIGGDIAHGDPANDHPATMRALEAEFVLKSADGERVVAADDFYLGTYYTLLEANELLTEIRVPVLPPGTGYAYKKLKRKTGDFAIAAACVVLSLTGDKCERIAITLTNVGPTPLRAETAEKLLTGKAIDDQLVEQAAQLAMEICDPAEDLRGDKEYKIHMAGEMTRRAIREAIDRARGRK
ncbi:MAG: xanthine dehydrogenase family protein subunit M [Pseudomonadota bacterium]|jgi:carbon-monoxide dehydrogenase medium subunit